MLGAWCPTPRPAGRPQQTIRHAYISTLKKLGFEEEKGQLREFMTVAEEKGQLLREWMTVARDRPAWLPVHGSGANYKKRNEEKEGKEGKEKGKKEKGKGKERKKGGKETLQQNVNLPLLVLRTPSAP
jgi:ribosomal protein L12E/L44/L45/RPP1/RPP2